MLQLALRQHPELWGGQESDYLAWLLADLRKCYELGCQRGKLHWLSGQNVSWEEFLRHVGYGINALYTSRSGGKRWVEQTPRYVLYMEDLARMFPGARFVFLIRDGRQVVHSLRHFLDPQPHRQACFTWRDHTEAGLRALRQMPSRVLEVRYERLIMQTEHEVSRICNFLGLDFHKGIVEFITSRPPVNSSFPTESRHDKLKPRWNQWTFREKQEFAHICGHLLIELGYEKDDSWIKAAA